MKRISDKKLNRLEKKKRKISAFINLISEEKKEKNGDFVPLIVGGDDDGDDNSETVLNATNGHSSSTSEMSVLKKRLAEKLEKEIPKFCLEEEGLKAVWNGNDDVIDVDSTEDGSGNRLTLSNIQELIIACILPLPLLSRVPSWCKMFKQSRVKKVAIFVLDYDNAKCELDKSLFNHVVQFESSQEWVDQIMNVPLSNRQIQKLNFLSTAEKIDEWNDNQKESLKRTDLLLSPLQLAIENYPLPHSSKFHGVKPKYSPVSDSSLIFSLDCEMCFTTADKMEVTRVSLVDEKCKVIYDSYVKPKNAIKDYLTRFSGITKKLLDPVKITLEDVQEELARLIPDDAILCGQSLNFDLDALQLFHPYVIDTSVIYNLSGSRHIKAGLKTLSAKFLKLDIQSNRSRGHDSCEDAIAAMKLVKLKLTMGKEFGDRVLQKNSSSHGHSNASTMMMTNYLEKFQTKLNVYYDSIDMGREEKNTMIVCTNNSAQLNDAIGKMIHAEKTICLVMTRQGLCYIKV